MGTRLLCCVAFCLLGAGEYWVKREKNGPHTANYSSQHFSFSESLLSCSHFLFHPLLGSFVAEVTQTPRYLVKEKGQKVNMSCSPEKAHTAFYWYQQNQKKELTFLINFRKVDIIDQTDLVKKRFSAQCVPDLHCTLEIPSSEEGDSALYFCASSLYTALKCTSPSVHKLVWTQLRKWVMPETGGQ